MSRYDSSKYEKAKEAARVWHEKYQNSKEENEQLKTELKRMEAFSNQLPDPELIDELETKIQSLTKTNKKLKKELEDETEKHRGQIGLLEREKILLEGRIQQLEESRRDLQERYNDLKQDFREQQKWINNTK